MWLPCVPSMDLLLFGSWGRSRPPLNFDSTISGGKARVIVRRGGFGTVRRTGFRPVLSYRRLRGLDHPSTNGDSGRLGAVLGAELAEDRADVEFDRALANE